MDEGGGGGPEEVCSSDVALGGRAGTFSPQIECFLETNALFQDPGKAYAGLLLPSFSGFIHSFIHKLIPSRGEAGNSQLRVDKGPRRNWPPLEGSALAGSSCLVDPNGPSR